MFKECICCCLNNTVTSDPYVCGIEILFCEGVKANSSLETWEACKETAAKFIRLANVKFLPLFSSIGLSSRGHLCDRKVWAECGAVIDPTHVQVLQENDGLLFPETQRRPGRTRRCIERCLKTLECWLEIKRVIQLISVFFFVKELRTCLAIWNNFSS